MFAKNHAAFDFDPDVIMFDMVEGINLKAGRPNKLVILGIIVGVVTLIVGVSAGFFIWQFFKNQNDPASADKATTQRIIDKVDKLYVLPSDEDPTVAQIKDKEKLKEQQFFGSAENGDYVLVYENAKIAILYREQVNKLVNVGPITSEGQAAGDQGSQQP